MKKIITAMGNVTLNNELKKYSKYDVLENDFFYQEAVIDQIVENHYDILVVSALLQGQLEFGEFIEKIRSIDRVVRIIVITDEIEEGTRRKLNDLDVVDIFLDSEIDVPDVIDAIDREESLIKSLERRKKEKNISSEYIASVKEEKTNYRIQNNTSNEKEMVDSKPVQKQEIIVFSGTNGAGKSTIATNFAKVFARKTTAKVLLIDLDTLNGNLDEILEIKKVPQNVEIILDENKKCGLNYAVELIEKNRFDVNVFDELVIDAGDIDVLTGNTSLHYCQNVLKDEHYNKILDCAKERYDFIIIDTSSNIFLDSTKWALNKATKVFFVTENNYISMKKSEQLIEVFTNIWGVWKEKIEVIINKETSNGIDLEIVKKILKDYKVVGKIKFGEENLEISYDRILETINYIPKTSIFSKLFMIKNLEIPARNRIPINNGRNFNKLTNLNINS